ncbi:MAG: hypothetical protein IJD78_01985 [Clostridia bacterium]|nr:hypothetical protein [Clostridia bacterium]MBQ3006310.1 hypothetical protein [Clostridia bacterium]
MNNSIKTATVNLDGLHSLYISVNEKSKTVVAELLIPDEAPSLIYAEKFDAPCNYLKAAIKKGIMYLNEDFRLGTDDPQKAVFLETNEKYLS